MQNDKRPSTFQDGKDYFYWPKGEITPICVTFLAYDPCPAFIIVSNGLRKFRCNRDDLFVTKKELMKF